MLVFGLKNVGAWSGNLVVDQGISILVASSLGPAALAVFSRPMSLVRHLDTIVNKFAMILTPTTGALQSIGSTLELQTLLLKATRVGVVICLFAVLFMSLMADPLIHLWMGAHYGSGPVLPILAVGYFLPISQRTVYAGLTGLNMHGKFGLISSVVSILIFVSGAYLLWIGGLTLVRSALLLAGSFTLSQGILLPIYACRKLNIPLGRYVHQVFILPALYSLPLAVALIFNRVILGDRPLLSLSVGCCLTGCALAPVYWSYFMSIKTKLRIKEIAGSVVYRKTGKGVTAP
jgi:O-antigen/teichoic acid export membrane protein